MNRMKSAGFVTVMCLGLAACGDDSPAVATPGDTVVTVDAADVEDDAGLGDVTLDTSELDVTPEDGGASDADGEDLTETDVAGEVSPDVSVEVVDGAPEVTDAGPQPCELPLELTAETQTVLAYGLLALTPSGGTGAYRFELVDNGSGGMVHELLGSYLAGGEVGVEDVVRLTDLGCVGEATLVIEVVDFFTVMPKHAQVQPQVGFTYAFEGGSGAISCDMALALSGGLVSPEGEYVAGETPGTDVVRCSDLETGEVVETTVDVQIGAALVPSPAQIIIPVGSTYMPRILGGSGHVTYTTPEAGVTWVEEGLLGESVGRYLVSVEDDFLASSLILTVDVIDALMAYPVRAGYASYQGRVETADINGDGHMDAVFALFEASISGLQSGAVYVYEGVEGGMATAPVRVITSYGRRDRFGRSLTLNDFNDDGLIDLAVGADGLDTGLADGGGISVYYGIEDGFFTELPAIVLPSAYSYDNLGYSLTSCDFNGDGWVDLAAGALYAENRDLEVQPTSQGGVFLWLGSEDGFSLAFDQARFGMLPDGQGAWTDAPNLQMGWYLASGEVNGDGACDLMAISRNYSSGTGRANDGAAFLYRGVSANAVESGGLTETPHVAWGGIDADDPNSQVGRYAAMGDLNGDGLAELLLAQYLHDDPTASGTNHGTLRVIDATSIPELAGPAEILSISMADWSSPPGPNSSDQTGWNVAVFDVDGDDQADLMVSSLNGEVPDSPSNTGTIAVYKGVADAMPLEAPLITYGGESSGDVFGLTFAPLGDLDGDGTAELFVFAHRNDELGPEVGRPYLVWGADGSRVPLDFPGEAAGSQVGMGVSFVDDLDGDGYPEILVGAPDLEVEGIGGVQPGGVMLYKGGSEGFSQEPSALYKGFTGHSSGDRMGYDVGDAGDFDGDGQPDLAILARYDDQPNSKNAYSHDGTCGGSRSNTGSVLIFKGSGDALPDDQPDFVWYGAQIGQTLRFMATDLDINGDGFSDFVAGGPDWDRTGANGAGGFSVVLGRPKDSSGLPNIICSNALDYVGLVASDNLGYGITSMGDVNQDGCDDFAVGAPAEDIPTGSQGSARVFFGWGGPGCPSEPTYVFLYPGISSQSGYALAGGHDATGDGVPDLLVGGPRLTSNGNTVGAVWLVPGDYIASLPTEPVVDGASPGEIHPYVPSYVSSGLWRMDGESDDEWLGRDVALVPNAVAPGVAGMAIASNYSNLNGTVRSGAVRVLAWDDDPASDDYGFDPIPLAVMGGETWRTAARFGEALDATVLGEVPVVAVGAPEASALGLDEGAAWVFQLAP